jgi:hypothetical protein
MHILLVQAQTSKLGVNKRGWWGENRIGGDLKKIERFLKK